MTLKLQSLLKYPLDALRDALPSLRLRVKQTPSNRRYGVSCVVDAGNQRLWAGDVGELSVRLLRGVDWCQYQIVAAFPYGRYITVAESQIMDSLTPIGVVPIVFGFDPRFDPADFVLYRFTHIPRKP